MEISFTLYVAVVPDHNQDQRSVFAAVRSMLAVGIEAELLFPRPAPNGMTMPPVLKFPVAPVALVAAVEQRVNPRSALLVLMAAVTTDVKIRTLPLVLKLN